MNITEDGNVLVTTGHPDVGGSRASISNVVAELLGVDHARVNVMIGDTQTIGFSNLTGGSRVTFASALVATAATEKVIGQLRARAAKIWDIDAEAVKWQDGMALPAGDNAGKFPPLSLKELAAKANEMGGPIGNQTQLNTTGADPGFATHCVDVEVDVDLGIVRVLRYTAAQDVGRALHPAYVEGQIQGGVVQGIGWALSEEYLYDAKGRVDNASFLDYRMPVCSDVPMIGDSEPQAPAGRARRGRGADRPAAGRDCQCGARRAGRSLLRPADVAAEGLGPPGFGGLSLRGPGGRCPLAEEFEGAAPPRRAIPPPPRCVPSRAP